MADDDSKKEQGAGAEAPKKKSRLLKFVLIPVIIAVQGAAAYFIVFNMLLENPEKSKETRPKKSGKVGQFYEIKDLVVNPAGAQGRRFLVMELGLESMDVKALEEAKSKEIRIRDALITLLTRKTPEDLLDITKQAQLKEELLDAINKKLSKTQFQSIYFNKYIMQ